MKKQKLVDDFVTVAGGLLKSLVSAKEISKNKMKERFEVLLSDLDFVKKVEIDELKALVLKSTQEIEELKKKLAKNKNSLKKK